MHTGVPRRGAGDGGRQLFGAVRAEEGLLLVVGFGEVRDAGGGGREEGERCVGGCEERRACLRVLAGVLGEEWGVWRR